MRRPRAPPGAARPALSSAGWPSARNPLAMVGLAHRARAAVWSPPSRRCSPPTIPIAQNLDQPPAAAVGDRTGSAPTSSAATSSAASSTARASRWSSCCWWSITVGADRSADRRVAGYLGGWVDARADAHHRHLPRLPAPGPGARLRRGARARASRTPSSPSRSPPGRPMRALARAETLTIRNADFIAAVRLQGASAWRIVLRHVVPLCLPSLIVRTTLDMAGIILTAAGLGFLGLGAQPPMPEWGAMISTGRELHLRPVVGRDHPRHRHLRRQRSASTCWATACATCSTQMSERLTRRSLEVENLRVDFHDAAPARSTPCAGVSFTLGRERLGIVGESGSGKSMTGRAILDLIPPPGERHRRPPGLRRPRSARPCDAAMRRRLRGRRIVDGACRIRNSRSIPVDDRRPADRRGLSRAPQGEPRARRASARSPCSRRCRSATRSASTTSTRTRSRAAWASA